MWQKVVCKTGIWLAAEIWLNLMGLDNIADYCEFLFAADKLAQVSGQIVDIYAAEDGDWCKLEDGRLIRIERIEAFES